jgi:uncharacterized protein (DUF2062 family)
LRFSTWIVKRSDQLMHKCILEINSLHSAVISILVNSNKMSVIWIAKFKYTVWPLASLKHQRSPNSSNKLFASRPLVSCWNKFLNLLMWLCNSLVVSIKWLEAEVQRMHFPVQINRSIKNEDHKKFIHL